MFIELIRKSHDENRLLIGGHAYNTLYEMAEGAAAKGVRLPAQLFP